MCRADSVRCSSVIGGNVSGSTSSFPPARATSRWLVWASASYGGSVITTSIDLSASVARPSDGLRQLPLRRSQPGPGSLPSAPISLDMHRERDPAHRCDREIGRILAVRRMDLLTPAERSHTC